jgi:hypothetical protein
LSKLVARDIPNLPSEWCDPHHLQCIYKRGVAQYPEYVSGLSGLNDVVVLLSTPKQLDFFVGESAMAGLDIVHMKSIVEQRWVPASRKLVDQAIQNLPAMRYIFPLMITEKFAKTKSQRERCQAFADSLSHHPTLFRWCFWADVLGVEAKATLDNEANDCSLLTQRRVLKSLPKKMRALATDAPTLQRYSDSIKKNLDVFTATIVGYRCLKVI